MGDVSLARCVWARTNFRWQNSRASPQIRRMRYIRLSAVLLLLACGDGEPTAPPTPVATSITLSATSLSFSSLGEQQQLSATVKDQSGATMASATVTWSSSNASVATVSSTGFTNSFLVTAVTDSCCCSPNEEKLKLVADSVIDVATGVGGAVGSPSPHAASKSTAVSRM